MVIVLTYDDADDDDDGSGDADGKDKGEKDHKWVIFMHLLTLAPLRFCRANICHTSIQFNILSRLAVPLLKEM